MRMVVYAYTLFVSERICRTERCRAAVFTILDMLRKNGCQEVRAMIETQYRQVCNLAIKIGFHHCGMIVGRRLDGTITEVIEMRKSL